MVEPLESSLENDLFILPEITAGKAAGLLSVIKGSENWTTEKRERTLLGLRHDLSRIKILCGIRKEQPREQPPPSEARKQREALVRSGQKLLDQLRQVSDWSFLHPAASVRVEALDAERHKIAKALQVIASRRPSRRRGENR